METEQTTPKKLSTPVAILIGAIIIALAIIIVRTPYTPKQQNTENPLNTLDDLVSYVVSQKNKIEVPEVQNTDHIQGATNPKITIVEYSDLECPFCKVYHETLSDVLTKYPNDVAWVYRHYPIDSLHKKARGEAIASECVAKEKGNQAFWQYINAIFEETTSNDSLPASFLSEEALRLGISGETFTSCTTNPEIKNLVDTQVKDAQSIGARGTPYSVLVDQKGNTYPLEGAYPEEAVSAIIDKLLQ